MEDFCIVSPDNGAKYLCKNYSEYFKKKLIVAEKIKNKESGKIESINFKSNINYKNAVIVDDMIDSGGTMNLLINLILQKNPKINIYIFCSHTFFSKEPIFLNFKQVKMLYTTNSINFEKCNNKVIVENLNTTLNKFIVKTNQ